MSEHWKSQYPLKDLNTFSLNEKATRFASFKSKEELLSLLEDPREDLPFFILGGGSNMLLTKTLEASVIANRIKGLEVLEEDAESVLIQVNSGENWHQLVQYTVRKQWYGIENLSLIPGLVGAAPIQNIGAYGVEIKDVFHSLDAIEINTGQRRTFNKEACKFAYRDSIFKNELKGKFIISSVCLRLKKQADLQLSYGAIKEELKALDREPSIKDVSDAVIRIRQSKLPDPAEIGNSGSFFKNPIVSSDLAIDLKTKYPNLSSYDLGQGQSKLAAGWLIEAAGWKGYRKGDAGVHAKQALVLVNYGNAKGADVWELAQEIMQDVKGKFGVDLEPEVNIL